MEPLLKSLNGIAPLADATDLRLRSIIKRLDFQKSEAILQVGEVCDQILFIESGLIRSSYLNENGEEVSNWFMAEGDFCISVLSFLRRIPSFETHVALEDCRCWGISYDELYETYRLCTDFIFHGLIITSEYYCRAEERAKWFRMQPKGARYALFMEHFPNLANRMTNLQLASFLGVRNRTLYDMRRDYKEYLKKRRNQ
jgi:CRP-like cAMP-binding protein